VIGLLIMLAGALVWLARVPWRAAPAPAPAPLPRVSIIVPARDEAHNLPRLLASLRALAPAPWEVIVVDDHSQDDTAVLARRAGAKVVVPPPLPAGWLGKPWACRAGAEAATGELLLFTDADTVHAPGSLAHAAAALAGDRADLLSVVPGHLAVRAWERLQGVFQLLLLVAAGRRYAIGQYLLFRREAYLAVGGHAAVRDRLAEDLAFVGLVEQRGGRYRRLVAPGLLGVRMYPEGLGAFVRGWSRSFRDGLPGAGLAGFACTTLVIAWLLGAPLAVATGGGLLPGALWAAAVLAIASQQRLVGLGRASALLYPVFTLVFVGVSTWVLVAAVLGRPVVWRGRRFQPPPLLPRRPR
jgi:4,4'-diaponeurosporenoate glycosyltransferase